MKRIVVAGSLNMDLVVKVEHQPEPGETVMGSDVKRYPGGKGANQAAAAARAGGDVVMLGMVGEDAFGAELRGNLERCGVDTGALGRYAGPSGTAFITVDSQGQNMIVVSPGANGAFGPEEVGEDALKDAALLVMQLEIPLETVAALAERAQARGVAVMLNPAPAQPLPDELLSRLDYLVVNEGEAALLSGRSFTDEAAALGVSRTLRACGPKNVVLTLGAQGLLWSGREGEGRLAAHKVEVVDTTAAGDAFCGALAARLAGGAGFPEAVSFANAAAALSVTRRGAQPSLPSQGEIERFLKTVSPG